MSPRGVGAKDPGELRTANPVDAVPLAVEIALEQARDALVCQRPGDALAALDAVWDVAQRTEEGWFLRSGALLALGLPGECERVAGQGLDQRPDSTALRFAQSLARLAVGDPTGAGVALQPALQLLPADPLLLAQHAVVLVWQGDAAGAEAALRAAGGRMGTADPAVQYARDSMNAVLRVVSSERTRRGAVRDGAQSDESDTMLEIFPDARPAPERAECVREHPRGAVQDASQGVSVAVRLGLRLIDETPEVRAQNAPVFVHVAERTADSGQPRAWPEFPARNISPALSPVDAELNGRGWDAAVANTATTATTNARAMHVQSPPSVDAHGFIVRIVAVSCIVIAAMAAARGYSAVAVACGIGAAWLALRRSADVRRRATDEWADESSERR